MSKPRSQEIVFQEGGIVKVRNTRTGKTSWGFIKTIGGKKQQSTGYHTRAKAEAALDGLKLRNHLIAIGAPVPPEPVTLRRLINSYLEDAEARGVTADSISNTRTILTRFAGLLRQDALVTDVTAEDLRRYRAARLKTSESKGATHPHSILFELKRIRTVLKSARRLFEPFNWTPPDLPGVQRLHQGRKITLNNQQIHDLLAAADTLMKDFIIVGLHTALRATELLELRRISVDFTPGIDSRFGRLRLVTEKSKKEDAVPLTWAASGILRRRLESGDLAFPISYYAARRRFAGACKRAKIPYGYGQQNGVVIHTLRHSAASYLTNSGEPLNVVQAITRHSTTQMVLLYSHPTTVAVGAAIERLGGLGIDEEPQEAESP